MSHLDLIEKAASKINSKQTKGGLCGDVASVVVSSEGKVYTGVCLATGSNVFCAEQIALGQMVTDGCYTFTDVVAVWKDEEENIFVIPPCGNCRQHMKDLDGENVHANVILDVNKVETLATLLPYHDWWQEVKYK